MYQKIYKTILNKLLKISFIASRVRKHKHLFRRGMYYQRKNGVLLVFIQGYGCERDRKLRVIREYVVFSDRFNSMYRQPVELFLKNYIKIEK